MTRPPRIEPVPDRRRDDALRFAAVGARKDSGGRARAWVLRHAADNHPPDAVTLYWACAGRRCVAAAVALRGAGGVAFLFHPPLGAPHVQPDVLVEVVAATGSAAIEAGASYVQALKEPDEQEDIALLRSAGFEPLAELVYLRRSLTPADADEADADGAPAGLTWSALPSLGEEALKRLIAATYVDSLDCPNLVGMRSLDDVLAGHKATGTFRPDCWHVAMIDGIPAGCVLVNDAVGADAADVVYMGVAPPFRGRKLGRTLMRRAAAESLRRGYRRIRLAADSANVYAISIYEHEGYEQSDRRVTLALRETNR